MKLCAHILSSEAGRFTITFNDAPDNVLLGRNFDHRGVRFYECNGVQKATLAPKSVDKLRLALASCAGIERWPIGHAESVFGLCSFASWVLQAPPFPWYYIFKFMRRRLRLISTGALRRDDEARVWPSIYSAWREWVETLLSAAASGRTATPPTEASMFWVIITDASLTGYGGITGGAASGGHARRGLN
jgi:hypothetical protein